MDILIFQKINNLAGKNLFLDKTAIFFAEYFGYFLTGFFFFLFWRKKRIIFESVVGVFLSRGIFTELIRFLWERPRPFLVEKANLLISHSLTPSFPSGHAVFFFTLSYIVFSYHKKAGVFFFFGSFLISLARVFCGVHWFSDIVAGGVVGVLVGLGVHFVFEKYLKK